MGKLKVILILLTIFIVLGFVLSYAVGHKISTIKGFKWTNKIIGEGSFFHKLRFWIDKEKEEPKIQVKIFMKAIDYDTRLPIDADFILKFGTSLLSEGKLKNNVWEEYHESTYNKTYELYAWDDDNEGDDYYSNKIDCKTLTEKDKIYCMVELKKQGKVSLEISEENIRIITEEGYIRKPMIGIAWNAFGSIIDIKIPEEKIEREQAPFEIQQKYDRFYKIDTLVGLREMPLSKDRLNEEIKNLHNNCSYSFTLNWSETIKEVNNMDSGCNEEPRQNKEELLEEYNKMYEKCVLQEESQRDVANSFNALYEKCNKRDETELIKDIPIELKTSGELRDYDEIKIYILDEGDYLDGKNLIKSYFGINGADIGVENQEIIKMFK